MTRLLTTLALSVALTATTLSPSQAQGYGWSGMMMGGDCPTVGMMGGGMMWGPDGMMGPGRMGLGPRGDRIPMMGALVEGRLAYLRAELGITDAQSAAWDAYAEALKARVESMQNMHTSMLSTLEDGTAIERLQARIANMETMLEVMKALQQPTEALYEVLSDEQKALADQLIGCGGM